MEKKVIIADTARKGLNLKALFHSASFIFTFARRDIKMKYAQTLLGILWSILQPLVNLAIFTVFFTLLVRIDTDEVPYILFAFSGIITWQYFTNLVIGAGQSLIQNQYIIKKIYFPRLVFPVSKIFSELVDFGISFILLMALMIGMGYFPDGRILLLPVCIVFLIFIALSIGIWFSALSIRFRDMHQLTPNLMRLGLWLTPVFYPGSIIPEKYQFLLYINPMAGVMDGFRWCLFGSPFPSAWFLISFAATFCILITGLFYFKRVEGRIADCI